MQMHMLQLLLGLHAIHTRRVVHRDIKPHNIFLGADDSVKIGDFGVSRMLSGSADMAMTLVGSPGYLAPELCSGEPYNEKADMWSLGVTLAELCALQHPFANVGSQAALMMRILAAQAPPLPPQYSVQLGMLLKCCMQRLPHDRPSALQLLAVPAVQQKVHELGVSHLLPSEAHADRAGSSAGSSANRSRKNQSSLRSFVRKTKILASSSVEKTAVKNPSVILKSHDGISG